MKRNCVRVSILLCLCVSFFSVAGVAQALTIKGAPTNGLVGYWTFDEGSGTKVYDRSGNNNTGAINGVASFVVGKFAQALQFDGSSTYVDVGNAASEKVSGPFSFSAWIYPTASTNGAIITKNNSSSASGSGFYAFKNSSNNIVFILYKGDNTQAQVNSASAIPLNAWSHVLGVYDGSTIVLYINGTAVTPVAATSFSPDNTDNLQIGKYAYTNSIYFPGKIDDVRFYNRALTASEAARIYSLNLVGNATVTKSLSGVATNGLVGWWTFDGSSFGSNIQDMSGNGNTLYFCTVGVDSCTTQLATSSVKAPGVVGQGVKFPYNSTFTTQAYMRTNPSPLFNLGSQGSWCAWTYTTELLTGKAGMSFASSLATSTYTGIGSYNTSSSQTLQGYVRVGGTAYSTGKTGSWVGGWHHECMVFNANASNSSQRFLSYIDGALAGNSSAGTAGNMDATDEVFVGNWGLSGSFPGKVDDVRVYNRPLTAQEVAQIYAAGGGKVAAATSTDSLATGLIGYWPFDGKYMNWRTGAVTDASGSGNTGYLAGFSTSTSPSTGKIGQALTFTGTSPSTSVDLPVITFTSGLTVSAWVKSDVISGGQREIFNNGQFFLRAGPAVENSGKVLEAFVKLSDNSVEPRAGSGIATTQGQWIYVTATWDGSSLKIYTDGVLRATKSRSGSISAATASVTQIGAGENLTVGGANRWGGKIDDVRVYNRALGATEILRLYNLGR